MTRGESLTSEDPFVDHRAEKTSVTHLWSSLCRQRHQQHSSESRTISKKETRVPAAITPIRWLGSERRDAGNAGCATLPQSEQTFECQFQQIYLPAITNMRQPGRQRIIQIYYAAPFTRIEVWVKLLRLVFINVMCSSDNKDRVRCWRLIFNHCLT